MANKTDNLYGVLLFEEAWNQLGEALKPYWQEGPIGKYLYCKDIGFCGHFMTLTFTQKQVHNRIGCDMTIWVPTSFVKFIAHTADKTRAPVGFQVNSE